MAARLAHHCNSSSRSLLQHQLISIILAASAHLDHHCSGSSSRSSLQWQLVSIIIAAAHLDHHCSSSSRSSLQQLILIIIAAYQLISVIIAVAAHLSRIQLTQALVETLFAHKMREVFITAGGACVVFRQFNSPGPSAPTKNAIGDVFITTGGPCLVFRQFNSPGPSAPTKNAIGEKCSNVGGASSRLLRTFKSKSLCKCICLI